LLEIKELTAFYDGVNIFSDLCLNVGSGEICTIVGPSGCGKSTLLKAVAGLLTTYTGEILFDGAPVSNKNHNVGYIPQNYGLLPWKTVEQNIITALKIKNKPLIQAGENIVDAALVRIGLSDHKKKYPAELSGGQQQRIAIARAFVLQPDILLMDEPFSALDAMTKEEMQLFFLDVFKEQSGATLFITHDIEEAVILGDKIVLMLPNEKIQILKSPSKNREDSDFIKLCSQIRKLMKRQSGDENAS